MWLDREEPARHVGEGRGWRDGRKGGGRKKEVWERKGTGEKWEGKEKGRGEEKETKKDVTLSVEKTRCGKI